MRPARMAVHGRTPQLCAIDTDMNGWSERSRWRSPLLV
jgi:hypothetical protein